MSIKSTVNFCYAPATVDADMEAMQRAMVMELLRVKEIRIPTTGVKRKGVEYSDRIEGTKHLGHFDAEHYLPIAMEAGLTMLQGVSKIDATYIDNIMQRGSALSDHLPKAREIQRDPRIVPP